MKSNVNVFIGVVLCAVLCGTFVWLRSAGEEDTWKPNEIYDQVHSSSYSASYTNATFSGSPQDGGVALSMSSSSLSRKANFYAGAHSGVTTMPIASSPVSSSVSLLPSLQGGVGGSQSLYTTSSAELKSFGGGGNGGAAMGGAARGNTVSSASLQGGAGVGFVSSPIAYSTARRGEMSSTSGTNPAMMVAENPAVVAMGAANAANGIYGAYSVMDNPASANYNQYTGMFGGGRMGIRGRQNGGPATNTSGWLNWLVLNGYGTQGADGIWGLDIYQLRQAYDDYVSNWNPTMGGKQPPTWDEWLSWFMGSEDDPYGWTDDGGDTYTYYKYVPVGDATLLVLFALLYAVVLIIRRKKATLS